MKGSETKQRLLQTGLDLMSVHGVDGVTLGQLATAASISKSGLFAHFKSKEQLQIELLDAMAVVASTFIFEPAMKTPPGLRRLRSVMEHWRGWWRRAGLAGGCPIASAFFELDDIDGQIRDYVATMEQEWRGQLAILVQEAVDLSELSANTDVDQFVWDLCSNYLGHHVSSRFMRSSEADERARRSFEALIAMNLLDVTTPQNAFRSADRVASS